MTQDLYKYNNNKTKHTHTQLLNIDDAAKSLKKWKTWFLLPNGDEQLNNNKPLKYIHIFFNADTIFFIVYSGHTATPY